MNRVAIVSFFLVLITIFQILSSSSNSVSAQFSISITSGTAVNFEKLSASNQYVLNFAVNSNNNKLANYDIEFEYDPNRLTLGSKLNFSPISKIVRTDAKGDAQVILYTGFVPGNSEFVVKARDATTVRKTVTILPVIYASGWIQVAIIIAFSIITMMGTVLLAIWIMVHPDGTKAMREVSDPIRIGAHAFLRTQYIAIALLSVPVGLILFAMYALRTSPVGEQSLHTLIVALIVCLSFLFGVTCSGIAGFIGMVVAVRANIRVASAALNSYSSAFTVAVRSGAFAGFLVVSLSVLGVAFIFSILYISIPSTSLSITQIAPLMVGFAFGASFCAIFAQLGGGIFTKAADVGADLVGKVEKDIPEDDVRNPAVIADLVGDNVGDTAGRSADIFESLSAENISCMILAGTLAAKASPQISAPFSYIIYPLVIHIIGMLASWIAMFFTRVRDPKTTSMRSYNQENHTSYLLVDQKEGEDVMPNASQHHDGAVSGDQLEDPTIALFRGFVISILIAMVLFILATYWLLYVPEYPNAWWAYMLCGIIGIITSFCFVFITIFYTDYNFYPVKRIIEASRTGAATNIIEGISVGFESTLLPVITISIALITSYYIGAYSSGIFNDAGIRIGGLYGTAVATVGMLSSSSFVLIMDVFGPISDNAGGIVEMSEQPAHVRLITDKLDASGNSTKALTKGYAIGSASLASFLLFSAFMDTITSYANAAFEVINLATVEVFIGALAGACLVYVFSSLAIRAVGKTAQAIIYEVRDQFRRNPLIMEKKAKPDYAKCVAIVTRSALFEMILPGSVVVVTPVLLGFLFRFIGWLINDRFLGAKVTGGFLIVSTIAGILMALFLNNAGGAWDNTKKAIELFPAKYGGKKSDTHKAAVIGDTVGDPFKDTAGPSIHVLIKLLASLALVVGPLFINQPN